MLTDLKPNHQADSLYTGKELSENSHLQIEPDTDRQLLNKNASEDSDTLDFDYQTDFGGDQALIEEAQAVSKSFRFFLSRTFKNLTTLGNELWKIYNLCVDSLGETKGEEKFNRWLDAEFGKSQNLAGTAMSLSQWYNTLEPARQRLVANNVQNWSVAALKKLTSLTDKLIAVLVKSGKQTEKSIERAIAISLADELAPLPAEEGDRPVTHSDWSSLRKRFNLRPRHIKVLKQKAESLASLSDETAPVVKVSHVNEAIAQCKEDPELLNQPAKKTKKNKIDTSTPAESPLQDNSDEAITELISGAIAGDMEKQQAANSRTIALLQQTIAERDATIAAQEEQMNNVLAGELEKAEIAHQEQMEPLRQTLAISSIEEMYTQEQVDEAIARDRSKRKGKVYTSEDVKKKIADAYKNMYTDEEVQEEIDFELSKERNQLKKEFDAKIAEVRAEILESADTAYAAKLASLEQALEEKDLQIASLEKQKDTAAAEKLASLEKELAEKDDALASMSEQTAAAVDQARAEEREKTESLMAEQITSLQQTVAELQRALAEKDQALASLEEQNANSVASGSPLMEKEREAAAAVARAEEREKMALVHASKLESLQKELAEKNQALASSEEEKTAAVAEARADEQAVAWHDIEMLQKEIKGLKAANHSLQTTREQLATTSRQAEELKSQLAETEKEYLMRTKVLEGDLNSVVESNHRDLETIKMLESGNLSMRHENRSLKDELAGYKNSEKMLRENYAKIQKAERLQTENERLKENLSGQMNQSVNLASEVQKLNQALSEIKYLQKQLTNIGAPGFQGESYISPLNGQTSQGIKSLIMFIQDLINNNFQIAKA